MKIFKGNIIWLAVVAIFSVSLWSCAGNIPEAQRVDYFKMSYGKSFESAKNNQILNPDAGENLEPVVGLNGEAAEYGVNKYKKSFKEQKMERDVETQAGTFNIMTSGGGK